MIRLIGRTSSTYRVPNTLNQKISAYLLTSCTHERNKQIDHIHTSVVNKMARRWNKEIAFQSELRNPVEVVYGGDKKAPDDVGVVFDKKPFKVAVKKYHLYTWCGCGRSHSQPFCDGTHANPQLKRIIRGGPVKYIAPQDKEIWFCMCKQVGFSLKDFLI